MTSEDKLAVAETIYRFALGLDTRDWDLYRSIFAEEVSVDYSSYAGFSPAKVTGDNWVAGVRPSFNGLHATQHSMTNPLVQIEGERARCRMYLWAHHVFDESDPTSWFTLGGYYDDTLVRSMLGPVGWLIDGVKLTVNWRAGDESIMSAGRKRGLAGLAGDAPPGRQ